ncbi:hypothetical protein [Bradyrhizobium zhanjiangense]|uniref:Uncharacterized protein n=1 Tax=Bradyrhizobium zhanjiangense TaxID=1325107 RepID=A0A4Q0Q6F7_9BRAD|nr:hypothetical protein [Bradyrhizobium zhanjiangense]RXG84226.1 hypothetical protein EAS61_39645 [Bradyrhizobium zhanjiangense]
MEGVAIIALIATFLPFLVSLGGRGGVWKFLSFLFCCFSIAGAASIVGIGGGILAWIVAWVFTAVAASARRNEERFAKLERRLLAEQEAAVAASPVERLIRQQEFRQRFVTPRQILALVLVFGLAATLILLGVSSDQTTISSKHDAAAENAGGAGVNVHSDPSVTNASIAGKANKSLEAVIIAQTDGGAFPAIVGVTNLPDDTKLMIGLRRKEASYFAEAKVVVGGGQFKSERFTALGRPLPPGNYKLEITMPLASTQTSAVQDIIGKDGERLTGKLVERSPLGIILNSVTAIKVGGTPSRSADEAVRRDNDAAMEKWRRESCQYIAQLSAGGRTLAECMAKMSQKN